MNAKHLIVTLSLMLAAGATFAALKLGHLEVAESTPVAECAEAYATLIPRVVITASRDIAKSAEAPVARVVVTARRSEAGSLIARASN